MRRTWALVTTVTLLGSLLAGGQVAAEDDESGPGEVASADQNDAPSGAGSTLAGRISTGGAHTCAVLDDATVRCWGLAPSGQLGYGNPDIIGDDETPAGFGPVKLGAGRTATAISAGNGHTCALLDNGSVRCWGFGGDGRLGYANTTDIGDNESPASVGPVDLGFGRTARAISAGDSHTCALLDNGTVRCWGRGSEGQLGYGNTSSIGDNETPGAFGPVSLGAGRTAVAITAGTIHTCALLDNGTVRCWGFGGQGRLGYGNTNSIGDNEAPAAAAPVNLGSGRTAVAITAGGSHTCALLDNGTVRCWGDASSGQLGYGNTKDIGDTETPANVGPVNLGAGRTAVAITAGSAQTCALLDNGSVRCWGLGFDGRLGYGNTRDIGDDETPGSVSPVGFGAGRTGTAITTGGRNTCLVVDDGSVRCWGQAATGELGYGNTNTIGDNESPATAGPVDIGGTVSLAPGEPSGLSVPVPSAVSGSTVTVTFTEPAVTAYDSPIDSYIVAAGGQSTVVSASSGGFGSAATKTVTVESVDRSVAQSVKVTATTIAGRSTSASITAPALRSRIFVSNTIASGPADYDFAFAGPGDTVVTGDWDGNGTTGFASRVANLFTLVDERGNPQGTASFGKASDDVFIGDWNANNQDTFAVRRGNVFFLRNTPTSGVADIVLGFGKAGDEVFVGDWNGNGQDTFAVRRGNVFFVRNSTTTGIADVVFGFGKARDEVLVGDWDQDGIDTFAVRRGNEIFIRNDFQTGIAQQVISFGKASDQLLVGDYDNDGIDTFAVRRLEEI
ncbi:MAG: hypothetical protein OEU32_14435 [Acidimicrobiia bacterium]|nr:hypothetical protein [Acidimicrobiia bacterium]